MDETSLVAAPVDGLDTVVAGRTGFTGGGTGLVDTDDDAVAGEVMLAGESDDEDGDAAAAAAVVANGDDDEGIPGCGGFRGGGNPPRGGGNRPAASGATLTGVGAEILGPPGTPPPLPLPLPPVTAAEMGVLDAAVVALGGIIGLGRRAPDAGEEGALLLPLGGRPGDCERSGEGEADRRGGVDEGRAVADEGAGDDGDITEVALVAAATVPLLLETLSVTLLRRGGFIGVEAGDDDDVGMSGAGEGDRPPTTGAGD